MPNELVRSKQTLLPALRIIVRLVFSGVSVSTASGDVDEGGSERFILERNNEERKSSAGSAPHPAVRSSNGSGMLCRPPKPLCVTPDGGPTQTLKSVRASFQRCNISTLREAKRFQQRRNTKGSGGFSILGAFRWVNRVFASLPSSLFTDFGFRD